MMRERKIERKNAKETVKKKTKKPVGDLDINDFWSVRSS
jgi:hypothetical protein